MTTSGEPLPVEPDLNAFASGNGAPSALVAIGGSAGAVGTLLEVAADLPSGLAAAILVVIHRPAQSPSALPRLLMRASRRPCAHARGGEALAAGRIYVAPPDLHMRVHDGHLTLDRGPRENRNRPAIDPMFRSAAAAYGPAAIGVLLSGFLDDGAAGLAEVKRHGGTTVIQDPSDAAYPAMPEAAARAFAVDYSVPGRQIGALLGQLVGELRRSPSGGGFLASANEIPTDLTDMSCPDCGGVLRVVAESSTPRFVCRVGHAFSAEALLSAQDERVEHALWFALTALRERAAGARRLFARFEASGDLGLASRYRSRVEEAERQAALIASVLEGRAGEASAEAATAQVTREPEG